MILNASIRPALFAIALSFMIVLGACDQEGDPANPSDKQSCNIAKESVFGTWVIKSLTIDPALDLGNGPVTDIYATWEPCRKDDQEQLLSNGTYLAKEGLNECPEPNQQTGTWDYDPGNCTVTISVEGQVKTVWQITEVTANALKIRVNVKVNNKDYTETRTYNKY